MRSIACALSFLIASVAAAAQGPSQYTTYFYTAGEAVVHGYEPGTQVRIVSLSKKGTLWSGTVNPGETKTVKTGPGVFGFLSDKKASILVGTPTSCAVVGYFLKDQDGSFLSSHFYTQLPSASSHGDERFIVWAYEPATVEIINHRAEKVLKRAKLEAGGRIELDSSMLASLDGEVLEVRAVDGKVAAQVYYDEGFIVPAENGRGSGKRFFTYVGAITQGVNDLNVIAQGMTARVKITDLAKHKVLFEGTVERGQIKTLTLSQVYAEVVSDVPVNVVVAGFKHYQDGYAEHHFATGLEGSGIDNDFMVTTSEELWLFSYFGDNEVTVSDARSGKSVFQGKLGSGTVQSLRPGFGLYRVKASKGLSAMGGASACGADYSPAGGMFAVDEALFQVLAQVREERLENAKHNGQKLSRDEINAPMSDAEYRRHSKASSGTYAPSVQEANERATQLQQQ